MFPSARATDGGVRPRPARLEDLPALAALDAVCFGPRRWPEEAWLEVVLHPRWVTLVAEGAGGELAAAAVLLPKPPVASLASLAVAPGWRRRGIGATMLDACLGRCRQARARYVVLEVDADNHSAVRLYRRFGFRPRRHFEEDGVPRIEMVAPLAPLPPRPRGSEAGAGS